MNLKRIGLDTSKAVFTLHGVDHDEKAVLRRNMRRAEMEAFFAKLPPTHVALEACGGSHHWGRRLASFGHTVQLIPPQYVKPFVKRGKNDRNDAEAISEAAARPGMPSVAVRSAEQQAEAIVLSARELLVRQRTQLVNAVRGHAAEFGIVAAKGTSQLPALLEVVAAGEAVPDAAKEMLAFLGGQVAQLDERILELERRMKQQHKANPVSQLLAEVPGIGPIGALSLALTIDPGRFQSGRSSQRFRVRQHVEWLRRGHQPSRQRAAAAAAGAGGNGGDPLRQTGEQKRLGLVVGIAGAQAAQARGSGSGQQDGPRRVGEARFQLIGFDRLEPLPAEGMMATGEAYRGSKTVATQATGAAVIA